MDAAAVSAATGRSSEAPAGTVTSKPTAMTEARRLQESTIRVARAAVSVVVAQASADEALVSSTVKDLVAGSGIAFNERGIHELKGIPGEWRLFAVKRGA